MDQASKAKLAELKSKLQREGFDQEVPADRKKWPRFLQDVREATGLGGIPFWRLFGVSQSTGYSWSNPGANRICPPEVMAKVADALGLKFAELADPEDLLYKVAGLPPEWREFVGLAYQHGLTLKDLQNYLKIRSMFSE